MKSAITFYAIAGSFALCTGWFASAQAADLTIYTCNSFNSIDSSTPSVTADPVNIAGGATIGQRAGSWSGNTFNPGQIIDNAEIVDIGVQSYSIGALKSQAEAYNQSDFVPQGVITSLAVNAAWGVGSPAGIAAFEGSDSDALKELSINELSDDLIMDFL